MPTILVSAGDLSGERYAAELVRALRRRRSDLQFVGLGGPAMAAAGVELVVDQRDVAVGGFFGLLASAAPLLRAWRRLGRCLEDAQPALVVLVDSGGFNLRFAARVRRRSAAKIFYYIAPQVWAWRPRRLEALRETCDRIAVILPFERAFHAAQGLQVDYVGHPILDVAAPSAEKPSAERRRGARGRLGLAVEGRLLGLFPGSRRSEVVRHLELMIGSLRRLAETRPGLSAIVVRAPTLEPGDFERQVRSALGSSPVALQIVDGDSDAPLDAVDVALAKPGTITLELLLRACPMVVVGRIDRVSAWIVRRTLRTGYLSMPNLLTNEEIVPELLQEDARVDSIIDRLDPLLEGPVRERQIDALVRARDALGAPGASERAARIVEELLGAASA